MYKKVISPPESYTLVPAVAAVNKLIHVPEVPGLVESSWTMMADVVEEEYKLCECVRKAINPNVEHQVELHVSWAAYHAKRNELAEVNQSGPTVTALLPRFPDDSKSVVMIRHSVDVVEKDTGSSQSWTNSRNCM